MRCHSDLDIKKLLSKNYHYKQNISSLFINDKFFKRNMSFSDFIDERMLVSKNVLGTKEMKIKVIEVSDETTPMQWKFGDRVKVTKVIITIKHLKSQKIEEGELDIEEVEKMLIKDRHYTSTNRWVPTKEIKNGYVINSRHTTLISDAHALDLIVF